MNNKQWIVYLIRCSDESLYCGISNNLKNRLAAHNLGRGAKYTRSRRPIELVGASSEMTKSDALKLEYRVKQVPASKKIFELIKGEDKMTMNLKKDLQSVNKELKALAKKVDKLIVAVEKLEKPKTKTEKTKPVKKEVATKSAPKKEAKLTAIDAILGFIKRSKNGADTAALAKKTGFNEKKIHNIVYKLKKQGKVKSEKKGVYVKA
ncbi:MAG: GIY-YIG nuclease family protein [Desulfobacterales bacterium]|uniref:GIY-YIG nuclease family protein n=1 Tax=Candidatus Desulfatibia profunda TaxID=2841695 RepID=A0A8J6NNX3_9BACT|nr:GIY-YIG nuclease family protein [Candidatus Desulfatibia profunda]MBL7180243.1 GIY-YIG nuclease family protein [Desulfobacterales bacterium]